MAADEDKPEAAKPDGERRGGRDRRQRPTVTIDLTAEKPAAATAVQPEAAEGGTPPEKSSGAAAPATPPVPTSAEPPVAAASPPPVPAPAPPVPPVPPTPPSSPPPPPQRAEGPRGRPQPPASGDDWTRLGIAAVAGGVIALVLVIVLQATRLLPVPGGSAANQAIAQAQSAADAVAALDRRIVAVEAMTADLPTLRSDLDRLATATSANTANIEQLASKTDTQAVLDDLAALTVRVEAAPKAAPADAVAALTTRVERLEATPVPTGGGDLDQPAANALAARVASVDVALADLRSRVDAVEKTLAAVPAAASATTGEDAARALAVLSLRRAADGGRPFTGDLDMAAALGVAGDKVAALRPFASGGVATREELAAEFPAIADAIVTATAVASPDTGFFSRVVGSVQGLVSIRPTGPREGSDPPAIVSRMGAAVAAGDLAAALSEREALPAAGKEASAKWAARAADRVSVDGLVGALVVPPEAAGQ